MTVVEFLNRLNKFSSENLQHLSTKDLADSRGVTVHVVVNDAVVECDISLLYNLNIELKWK